MPIDKKKVAAVSENQSESSEEAFEFEGFNAEVDVIEGA